MAELISECNIALLLKAHVAELVDAPDSKSGSRKGVKVRFLSWAQIATLSHFIFKRLRKRGGQKCQFPPFTINFDKHLTLTLTLTIFAAVLLKHRPYERENS